jgi:hypothetical protein
MEETYLVELLQINSSDLVDRFQDIIEDKFEYLKGELEDGFDTPTNDDR